MYIILDGNHHVEAMKNIRHHNSAVFGMVTCHVYSDRLTTKQALAIGYATNSDAENVLKMSDFERVAIIRKIAEAKEDAGKDKEVINDV